MTDIPQNAPNTPNPTEDLVRSLRRKEGTWVEWGQACQSLQKAGYNPQTIFEETGFEPVQQNQIIVGSQVYGSIVSGGVSDAARSHFQQRGSDILYELRILSQAERAAAAEYIWEKKLDVDGAREVAKAIKEFSRVSNVPEGFSEHPGDAAAYQCWKAARQKSDLQERSRLIARGLSLVHSQTARQKIEKLLTDFSVTLSRPTPLLPLFRVEAADELPRVLPVAGEMPLTAADLQAVPILEATEPFGMVKSSGNAAWVPIPGWQVVLKAEDPVVILSNSDQLPAPLPGKPEPLLIVVDRWQRQWDANSYFIIEQGGQLQLRWFEDTPDIPLLGQVILILRPKKILDEEFNKEPWQMDE